jgi:hypothetical protein
MQSPILPFYFLRIRFNNILASTPTSEWCRSLRLSPTKSLRVMYFSPCHTSSFHIPSLWHKFCNLLIKQITQTLISSYWTPHIFLSTHCWYVLSLPSTWQPIHSGSINKRGIISCICAIYERAHFAFVSVSYTWKVFSKPLLDLPKNDNCRYACFIPRGKGTLRTILEVSL